MKKTPIAVPVFFSRQLFDYLKIDSYKRATAQSKLEYLRLNKEDIASLTRGKISKEGIFRNTLHYVQFDLKSGFLLCVFNNNKCCRSYFFPNLSAN